MVNRRMGLQHIEAFRAIVMAGSMTKAAEYLLTSQPQISRLISQLEQITGFLLFSRQGTRITITAEGSILFEAVEKSFLGLSDLETTIANINSFKGEHLHVTAMPRIAGGLLTRIVAKLKLDHPNAMVSIRSGAAIAVHNWISTGVCDVGIAMLHGDYVSFIDTNPLFKFKCVCVLPAEHPLTNLEIICASDLGDQDFITYSPGSSLRAQIDNFFRDVGIKPRIVAETDLGASACTLVANGLGISLINPMAASEEALDPRIAVRPISPDLFVTLALVFPPYRPHTHLVKKIVGYAKYVITEDIEALQRRGLW